MPLHANALLLNPTALLNGGHADYGEHASLHGCTASFALCAPHTEVGRFYLTEYGKYRNISIYVALVGKKAVKVMGSLKSAKSRDRDCKIVRRKGRIYVINKKKPRFKARQGY